MLVQKNRWWILLPVLALLAVIGFASSGAFASTRAGSHSYSIAAQPRAAAPLTNYMSTDVPKTVPDTGTVTSTLTIVDVGVVSNLEVINVSISDTFPGDLNVYLISPLGTRVQLFNAACGGIEENAGNTNFNLSDGAVAQIGDVCPPGGGTYKPLGSLAAFDGTPIAGIWTLELNDTTAEDIGTLLSWGLANPGAAPEATPTTVPLPTLVPSPQATTCPINFSDVHQSDYFYLPVQYLFCKGTISGYSDGTFRPYNFTTRSQMAKIAVLGLNVPLLPPPATPSYSDVPPSNPFYQYIEAGKLFNVFSGYSDGTFRPYNYITRGQLTKMIVNAAGVGTINPATPSFSDVPPSDPFYQFVETAACYDWVSGYNDGTFKPVNNATRGQISKIVYQANVQNTPCAAAPTPIPLKPRP
ncbi:MAG: S-layer homology domain-containing protein [Chloroflexia bacterium]